jgi:hypothetical protein
MSLCRYAESHYAECLYVECLAECCYAEYHYAECSTAMCRYAECRGALFLTNLSYLEHVNNVESHAGSGQDGRKSRYDVPHGVHFRRGFLVRGILDVTKKNHLELITREALLRGKDQYR